MTKTNESTMEIRHCFRPGAHSQHAWHEKFWCEGQGIDADTEKVRESPSRMTQAVLAEHPTDAESPVILDARQAYGDRVANMADQAAMINAYLGGREVTAVDVPIIFILVKAHRLGKMPDYKDNYDDIKGYLQIAEEVIGEDMIEASTAKEYAQIKRQRREGSGNPYSNVEGEAEAEAMTTYLKDNES